MPNQKGEPKSGRMTPSSIRFTEYLDLDLQNETWKCNRCHATLASARKNYKEGCLVYDRDPHDIYPSLIEGTPSFSPDMQWCRILEFYCPNCGSLLETEPLPPGHPITYDIEINIDSIRRKFESKS